MERKAEARAAKRLRRESEIKKRIKGKVIIPKLTTQTPDMLDMMEDDCGEVILEEDLRMTRKMQDSTVKNTKNMVKRMVMKKIKEKSKHLNPRNQSASRLIYINLYSMLNPNPRPHVVCALSVPVGSIYDLLEIESNLDRHVFSMK